MTRAWWVGRVVRRELAFLVIWCLAGVMTGAAWAGHVPARFVGPDLPEPEWETFVSPQVSGANVAYQLHYPDEAAGAGVWAIGGGLPAPEIRRDCRYMLVGLSPLTYRGG